MTPEQDREANRLLNEARAREAAEVAAAQLAAKGEAPEAQDDGAEPAPDELDALELRTVIRLDGFADHVNAEIAGLRLMISELRAELDKRAPRPAAAPAPTINLPPEPIPA